jgi:hypothetical protein
MRDSLNANKDGCEEQASLAWMAYQRSLSIMSPYK